MPTRAITFKKTNKFKRMFILVSGAFLLFIVYGSIYVENEPRLSLRAIGADIQGIFLTVLWSPYRSIPAAQSDPARGIPVLTFHRLVSNNDDINNVTISNFRDQMLTLKKAGWQTVTLEQFEQFMRGEIELPEKSFLLTFDDAASQSFYPVDPILKALNFHAVNFVIVASSEISGTTYYLQPKELKMMLSTGRWSLGSHSFDGHHPYPVDDAGNTGVFFADRLWLKDEIRIETPDEFKVRVTDDLTRAKTAMEETYQIPVNSFAFPLGNETGIAGANNFPEGANTTNAIARIIYKYGFLQLNRQQFTINFPAFMASSTDIATETKRLLGTDFEVRRIHVDHDWDGQRLLSILENGRIKRIPYEDDFSTDNGWINAWGSMDIGRNNFVLSSDSGSDSAQVFLDGTELWDEYSLDAAINWTSSDIFVLGDVINSQNYDSCVFSPGSVRIQKTENNQVRTIVQKEDPRIAYGNNVRVGIRVHGSTIECAWNFGSVVEAYERNHSGGIGFMVGHPSGAAASVQVSSIIARPFAFAPESETQAQEFLGGNATSSVPPLSQ